MKMLFITSTNLATNPRLVKEITLACQMGFSGTVLQFCFQNWSDAPTKKLELQFPSFSFISIPATKKNIYNWFISSFFEKLFRFLPISFLSAKNLSYSVSKRSFQLLQARHQLLTHYDWVIAHNPAAFYPAMFFSSLFRAKFGIDVEDYHPGEGNNLATTQRVLQLFKVVLPLANYCSYASDLIREQVQREIKISDQNHFTIINSFFRSEFKKAARAKGDKLKLVWFSQYIDYDRGLEPLLQYVSEKQLHFELHLIGNLKYPFGNETYLKADNIYIHPPIDQDELHTLLSEYDIGLALEPGKDLNNQLALSNKLLAYIQAGLLPLVSSTPGQTDFLNKYNIDHVLFPIGEREIDLTMQSLYKDIHIIRDAALKRFESASSFDFSAMSLPLLKQWYQS
jgi:glycosyltransferase involved in cell wall biosynthesis